MAVGQSHSQFHTGVIIMLKPFSALLTMLFIVGGSSAQDHAKLIPTNAAAFVSINMANLWDAESLKPVRDAMVKVNAASKGKDAP